MHLMVQESPEESAPVVDPVEILHVSRALGEGDDKAMGVLFVRLVVLVQFSNFEIFLFIRFVSGKVLPCRLSYGCLRSSGLHHPARDV